MLPMVNVAYAHAGTLTWQLEYPSSFLRKFSWNPNSGLTVHSNPAFHSFQMSEREHVFREATPSILMTESVYEGFRSKRPPAIELQNDWFYPVLVKIPGYEGKVYGGDVIWSIFKG